MGSDALIATLALGGMCLLMWWLARLARKRMGVGAGTVSQAGLRVVGKRPLDQKHSLFVVEIAGGRHILVGAGMEGGVTKLDDISPDEFAAMTDEKVAAPAKPKLRVAAPHDVDGSDDGDAPTDELDGDAEAETPKLATVGESFQALLGRARSTRSSKRASGE